MNFVTISCKCTRSISNNVSISTVSTWTVVNSFLSTKSNDVLTLFKQMKKVKVIICLD